jgi:preprotein translocase subunit SecG
MIVLKVFLYIVEVAVCLLLGLIVMLQKPKEGGLGGAFGGGALEASLGADAGNVLIKATAILGTIFLLNTLILAKVTSRPASVVENRDSQPAATEQTAPAPAAETPAT